MSCLLPQFKCSPDTFAVNFKSQGNSILYSSKSRDAINFRTQCVLSTTSRSTSTATTAVLEYEKLHLSTLEAIPNSVPADRSWTTPTSTANSAVLELEKLSSLDTHPIPIDANKPWTYVGEAGSPSEANFGTNLDKATLLMSEEAVIYAAASEALALAKAAVKVAKDAAMMVGHHKWTKSDSRTTGILPDVGTSVFEKSQLADPVQRVVGGAKVAEVGLDKKYPASYPLSESESDDVEPSAEELEFLEAQFSMSIAVRSKRQTERKARRTRAAEKAAAKVVSVQSGSPSKKKISAAKSIDYSDPLRYYRTTLSNSKLLTASEEKVLSEGVQVLLKLERLQKELTERYSGEPTFAQWAAAAGVDKKTLRDQINYGYHCKDKMINSNIRLVISIAKHYRRAGMDLQDLVQEGCRGLVRGVEKFDASRGFKFSTYAHWWIKQAVRRALSEQSRLIRIPFHVIDAMYKVKEAKKQFFLDNGKHPDDEELAKAAGISMKRLAAVRSIPKTYTSTSVGPNQDLNLSDVIADPNAETSEDVVRRQFMKQDLAKVVGSLNPKERQVINWRFGLEDGRMKTLQEIGELLGVSRERIRQIELCALRKLKNKKRSKHLQQYAMP